MPRFNPKTYKPESDSSRGCGKRAQELNAVVLVQKTRHVDGRSSKPCAPSDEHAVIQRSCPCGCGEYAATVKTHFKMGHDARFRGKLIRAHTVGAHIVFVVDGEEQRPRTARDVATEYGDSFTAALDAADLRVEGKNREVLQKALHSKRLVKVGRHEYTGQVVAVYEGKDGDGSTFDIEYVTKSGAKKRIKGVPAKDAPVVKSSPAAKGVAEAEKKSS